MEAEPTGREPPAAICPVSLPSAGDGFEQRLADVKVGVDALYVVVIVERVEHRHDLLGRRRFGELDQVLR